ncbi:MAG: type IV secretion system protein, partial [Methylophilaceae bacterium]|nr:type IV secretion system protein [Methylophilaceae bacterium]
MTLSIFQATSQTVITPFLGATAWVEKFIAIVTPLILAGLTISIMWYGFQLASGRGSSNNVFLDVFWRSARVLLVFTIALAGGAYMTNVVGVLLDLQCTLNDVFATGSGCGGFGDLQSSITAPFKILDDSVEMIVSTLTNICTEAKGDLKFTKPDTWFAFIWIFLQCLAMGALCIGYAAVVFLELIGIQIGLIIMFGVGPVFVACYAFETTAKFFDTWFSGLLKYIFTSSILLMMLSVSNVIFKDYATKISNHSTSLDLLGSSMGVLVAIIALIFMVRKVPELVTNMIGGALSSSSSNAVGAATGAAGQFAGRAAAHAAGNTALGQKMAQSPAAQYFEMVMKSSAQGGGMGDAFKT